MVRIQEESMAPTRKKEPGKGGGTVDNFMRDLEHPFKAEIQAVRSIILGASPDITEGIKWNAPSFACGEYFATIHLRARDCVQVIFHLGAKVRDVGPNGITVPDPAGLLQWLAKDRATAKFADMRAIRAQQSALAALVREWTTLVR